MRKVSLWLQSYQSTIQKPQYLVDLIAKYADTYETMAFGEAQGALSNVLDDLNGESETFLIENHVDVSGGDYGTGGQRGPVPGQNGQSGTGGTATRERMTKQRIRDSSEMHFHPDQIAMTIRDIEDGYFIGSKASLDRSLASIRTLVDRLDFLPDLVPSDPLFQAYNNEDKIFIIPSKTDIPTSITSIQQSLSKALGYASQLGQGLDFYGHTATWVPQGSYEQYGAQLDHVLDNFAAIETNYETFKDEAATEAQKLDVIKHSEETAKSVIQRAKNDQGQLQSELNTTASLIHVLSSDLPNKRTALVKEIDKLADEIKNAFQVSFADFINGVTQMVGTNSLQGILKDVCDGAGFINGRMDTVTDDLGVKVNKDYIVNKITVIGGEIQDLQEGLSMGHGGEMAVDDPGAAKLILEENNLMDLIGKYRNILGDNELKTVKSMFDDYVNAVSARNDVVMHYNSCLQLWLQADDTITSQQQQLDDLGRIDLTIDTNFFSISAFVEQAYFYTTAQVLRILYLTERALKFWSLGPDVSDISVLREGGFRQSGLSAALMSAKINILDAFNTAIEGFTSHSQIFGKTPGQEGGSPIKVFLTDAQLQDLRGAGNTVILAIPEAYSHTSIVDNPFSSCADVRLTYARFYIDGAQTADGNLTVSLQHSGSERIIGTDDRVHNFTHNALNVTFKYELATRDVLMDGNLVSAVDNVYALIGPFTSWRVKISDVYNDLPDLSNVTSAWFEFSGYSRSFDATRAF
ncbi:hypothetical protein SERLA73DRAFT_92781 [Serpula lacrymans var. lacrymans S7.3]|uniref:Uncharacterized protein n=2 Tax=Serpula lacrymans var. lacrymans TaxID=341189 RepID=F8Q343_SERL3|nr:hypothetical protein SERLA73DRAFT_92781 [Serpula lacrymans var. lacrymans S7.3]